VARRPGRAAGAGDPRAAARAGAHARRDPAHAARGAPGVRVRRTHSTDAVRRRGGGAARGQPVGVAVNPLDLEPARPARAASPTEGLAFLWRGRFTIALATLLGAGGGVFYAQHRGTIYRARSVLYVERDSPMMPGSSVSLWLQSRNYANTQAALLRSTPILEQCLANPSLASSPLFGDSTNRL